MCHDSVQERLNEPARTGGETHFGIVTEGLGYGYAGDANSVRESLPVLSPCLVRIHPGRPAAHPTATGWDEELLDRTAGVRLPLRVIV